MRRVFSGFWNLDTEGSELVLLKSFPWSRHAVRCIAVEHNNLWLHDERQEELCAYLTGVGYRRAVKGEQDDYYAL